MKFYNSIALLLLTAVTSASSCAQSKVENTAAISQIKEIFRQINEYKNYKAVTIEDSEEFLGHATDNGGSLKGFYKDDSLKKIIEWVGLSNRAVQNEYYFNNGKLVFLYSTHSNYEFNDSTGTFDHTKFSQVFNGRYYFRNENLIDAILSDKEFEKTKEKDAAEFLSAGRKYIKLLYSNRH